MTIATGSGTERAVNCRASSVLPRAWPASNVYAAGGHERHGYLERISNGTDPDEALALVHPDHRASCEEIDLVNLAPDLQLAAEVTLVYRPATDEAYVLGQGLARDYREVAEDEIPGTLDLVGVNLERRHGQIKDYKSGWLRVTDAANNWQIKGGALALARAYDLDTVTGELIYVRPGQPIQRDRAEFTPSDLLLAAAELREFHARALADRAAYARGEHVEPTEGTWCRYCPSQWCCPARVGLIRAALAGDLKAPVVPADAARLRPRIKEAIKLLGALDAQIVARAAAAPIKVEDNEDGTATYLGEVVGEGNEKLAAKVAIPIAAQILKVPPEETAAFIEEVANLDVTKKALAAAIKKRVRHGEAAATERRILAEVRAAGGAVRPPTKSVELYTVPAAPGEARQ